MTTSYVAVPKGWSIRGKNKEGYGVGTIAAIEKNIVVTVENVADVYYIISYHSECGAYIQINCDNYEVYEVPMSIEEEVK